ncbi:hypothetical protein NDA13_005751 [Ustilago tritici]|nr:hypothetical protein NDA13_005751 [Ustilago tritici]
MSLTQESSQRRRPRRGGSRCSHSARLDVPSLELGSKMSLQLAHERNGILLAHAHSSSCGGHRGRIIRALQDSSADPGKAQACGHCNQLTARLAESLLHHLLFAKGQLPEPVSLIRKKRELTALHAAPSTQHRSKTSSARARKEDKLLRKLEQLRVHLEQAAAHLATSADNNGQGPSRRPGTSSSDGVPTSDIRLLVVMGSSATMPREVFVLDLIQAIGPCGTAQETAQHLFNDAGSDAAQSINEQVENELFHLLQQSSEQTRDAARDKTSSNWERKLVRLLVSDERLEPFLGTPLAPTKMHLFLSAPTSFRSPGWSARPHLDFDLDRLCKQQATDEFESATSLTGTSMSSPHPHLTHNLKKAALPPSPLRGQGRRWSKTACQSSSSVAESWPEESSSDHVGESSMSSVSDDSRPPFSAEKLYPTTAAIIGTEDWLPRCSSPLAATSQSQSNEDSRTASSLGSSTVYGHDTYDAVIHSEEALMKSTDQSTIKLPPTSSSADSMLIDSDQAIRCRSREPKAGSLLSRNLLKGRGNRQHSYVGSDSSSVRSATSSSKRAPRCAGLQIDFTDPERPRSHTMAVVEESATLSGRPAVERCWFQCEAVLEGFR